MVPAGVADGPVRLALCADCRRTLETVVDPLLDAREADTSSGDDNRGADAAATGESEGRPATASDGRAAATAASSDAPDADRDTPTEDGATDASTGESDTDSDDGDDGITIEEPSSERPAERPDGYAQVLRLLENRDGGMPRGDLRSLATNAYDLTDTSFEAAVEAAVENGDVADAGGTLRRT